MSRGSGKYFHKSSPDNGTLRNSFECYDFTPFRSHKIRRRVEVQTEIDAHCNEFTCGDAKLKQSTALVSFIILINGRRTDKTKLKIHLSCMNSLREFWVEFERKLIKFNKCWDEESHLSVSCNRINWRRRSWSERVTKHRWTSSQKNKKLNDVIKVSCFHPNHQA